MELKKILEDVKNNELDIDSALEILKDLPYEDLGYAHIDHHRSIRNGYPEVSQILKIKNEEIKEQGKGKILIVTGGTSDIPVADEAYFTAEFFGNKVERLYDVGVAGIHRLLSNRNIIEEARVIVAVAGMEGALPSVVGGLVDVPVIAVPTSVGYGANFDGLAPLLAMLNSCASGISVVNIDNGFGAGYLASIINKLK